MKVSISNLKSKFLLNLNLSEHQHNWNSSPPDLLLRSECRTGGMGQCAKCDLSLQRLSVATCTWSSACWGHRNGYVPGPHKQQTTNKSKIPKIKHKGGQHLRNGPWGWPLTATCMHTHVCDSYTWSHKDVHVYTYMYTNASVLKIL